MVLRLLALGTCTVCVCVTAILALQAIGQPKSDTNGVSATQVWIFIQKGGFSETTVTVFKSYGVKHKRKRQYANEYLDQCRSEYYSPVNTVPPDIIH